jgi:chromosome segregation ATPase
VPLDSPQACTAELAAINEEIQAFSHVWAANAGELKEALKRYDRLHRAAILKGKQGLTVAERDAAAHAAVEGYEEGLTEKIEELENKVEKAKTLFRTLERRSENARSILSALKAEARMPDTPEPQWSRHG